MSDNTKAQAPQPSVQLPTVQDLFKAGVQFGHQTSRWNPKMKQYIYDSRNGIHIVDVSKTRELIGEAMKFLIGAASQGNVIFVGTKKQSSIIVRESAVQSGAHFVDQRWAGGLLTNFKKVRESFLRLRELETLFEKGVEGRTKYEISLMKKEWAKLNRLYSGVKTMDRLPTAVVVVDTKFEKGAVREARNLKIPVVGILDTNSDPDVLDFVIPANDDAIASIKILFQYLANAVTKGNKEGGVKHHLKDYSKYEVQIIRKDTSNEILEKGPEVSVDLPESAPRPQQGRTFIKASANKSRRIPAAKTGKATKSKGILEKVQEEKEQTKKTTKKSTK